MTRPLARNPAALARRHACLQVALLVVIVSGFAWNNDAWLFVRLRIAADDAFTFGYPERPSLLMDASDELKAFPPTRIAAFLEFPAPRIRSAAAMSLSERWDDRDPAPWIGVAPKLLRSLARETDGVARGCACEAAKSLPVVPAEDVGAVVSFVEEMRAADDELRPVETALVEKAVRTSPALKPWAVSLYGRWSESSDADERRAGCEQLLALAPDAPVTVAAFRAALRAGDPDGVGARFGPQLLRSRPAFLVACLQSGPRGRDLLLNVVAAELRAAALHLPIGDSFHRAAKLLATLAWPLK
jgi:hypothetical protein